MAYNNYYPVNYQPMYQIPQQQSQSTGIIWVQGEAGAKSYPVAPNASVLLMDAETSSFYIKSADSSGMPLPLRIFDYSERTIVSTQSPIHDVYVTREEFEKRLAEIKGGNNVESVI